MTRITLAISMALLAAVFAAWALGCTGTEGPPHARPGPRSITVFAAASLSEVFRELAGEFEARNPGASVKLDLDGSQRLRSQLEFGAAADVFASADWRQMDLLANAGLLKGAPQAFASAGLAVIVANSGSAAAIGAVDDLAIPGVRLILAHEGVPVGAYSRQMLKAMSDEDGPYGEDFGQRVLANVVSNESNVRQVLHKVALGEADAGIVYRPLAAAAAAAGQVRLLPVPEAYDVAASYPIAVLRAAAEPGLAGAFVSFVLSLEGRRVLEAHGFGRP